MRKAFIVLGIVLLIGAIAAPTYFWYAEKQKNVNLQQDALLQLAFYQEYGQTSQFTGAGKVDDARIVQRVSGNITVLSFYVFDKRIGAKFIELGVLKP